jgi:hypothetical protein
MPEAFEAFDPTQWAFHPEYKSYILEPTCVVARRIRMVKLEAKVVIVPGVEERHSEWS